MDRWHPHHPRNFGESTTWGRSEPKLEISRQIQLILMAVNPTNQVTWKKIPFFFKGGGYSLIIYTWRLWWFLQNGLTWSSAIWLGHFDAFPTGGFFVQQLGLEVVVPYQDGWPRTSYVILLMAEIRRSPVEVGSSWDPWFTGFHTSRVVQDFSHQE